MLIPRFSLKWLLIAIAVASLVAFTARQAVMGEAWGVGAVVATGAMLLTFFGYIVVFGVSLVITKLVELVKPPPAPESPFATSKAPPQVIAPTGADAEE